MISCRSQPDSNIVEFTVDGDVSRTDFDAVVAEVDGKIEDYGSVNLLQEIRSIGKLVRMLEPLVSTEVRAFGLDEIDAAREWLRNALD